MFKKRKLIIIALIAGVIFAVLATFSITTCGLSFCKLGDKNCNCVIICSCGSSTDCYDSCNNGNCGKQEHWCNTNCHIIDRNKCSCMHQSQNVTDAKLSAE
jgi:hypothetical protein